MTEEPRTALPFEVAPELLDGVMAAVAFLFADDLDEAAYERLMDPSDRTRTALNKLVAIRLEGASGS